MDPITTAIVMAITLGVVSGTSKVSEQAIVDSYNALKNLIKNKFGTKSEIINAVESLETKPNSSARKELLKEEVMETKANDDKELVALASEIIKSLETNFDTKVIQQAIGNNIAIAIGNNIAIANDHSSAKVDVRTQEHKK